MSANEARDPCCLISTLGPPIPSMEMAIRLPANSVWQCKVLQKVETSITPFWMFGMKSISMPMEHSLSSLTKAFWCQNSDNNSLVHLASFKST